jgi:hypothetical protein
VKVAFPELASSVVFPTVWPAAVAEGEEGAVDVGADEAAATAPAFPEGEDDGVEGVGCSCGVSDVAEDVAPVMANWGL